jgi:ornithine decarboxylase/arginine decarboxylase
MDVVAEYLRQNRIVPEKNGLNSLLFLLTPGVEGSKAGTLLSHLVTFKQLHDRNAPLDEVIPDFVAARRRRYSGLSLRDLCAEMHTFSIARRSALGRIRQPRPCRVPTARRTVGGSS